MLERNGARQNPAVELGQHHVPGEIGGPGAARAAWHQAARLVDAMRACSPGTSGPSSGVGSPGSPPAAKAVVHTITAGSRCARADAMKGAATRPLAGRP